MGTPYETTKRKLLSIIKEMSASSGLFVKAPGRDFTRKRKLSFETMLRLLLGMGAGSLQAELLEHSGYAVDTATSLAFIQQRDDSDVKSPFPSIEPQHIVHPIGN